MPIDMSAAAKAPPRRQSSRTSSKAAPVETRTNLERRTEGLYDLGQAGQGVCLMMQQWADAAAIGKFFPNLADELAKVAETSDFIAKPIDFLIELGPWTGVIIAGMPLVLQIMANHKMLNASKMVGQGIVPPEVLEAQMRAQVAKMQTEALQAQQLAMQEAQQAQAEYERFMAENANMTNREAALNVPLNTSVAA